MKQFCSPLNEVSKGPIVSRSVKAEEKTGSVDCMSIVDRSCFSSRKILKMSSHKDRCAKAESDVSSKDRATRSERITSKLCLLERHLQKVENEVAT